MTTLPNASIVLPTRGAPGSGLWADALDAALTIIDAMDHTPGKGPRIPTAGININGDLTFSSLYAPTNLHRLSFAEIASLTGNNKSLYVKTDHELYWKSNAGTEVKMTVAGALNVAAFTGGIGGDYSAVGAAVAFDDAGDRYTFKQQAPGNWARLASGDVRLFETGTTESVFVGLAAPAALAGSYTITMPLAAPGSTQLMQMDSAGVLTASNTVANAATFSAAATFSTSLNTPSITGTPNFTGAVTMASTLGVTGLVTATAGATAAANQHVTVSGTGRHKHGSMTLSVPASAFVSVASGTAVAYGNGIGVAGISGVGLSAEAPVTLSIGHRIVNIRFRVVDNATGTTTVTCTLLSTDSAGTMTAVAAATSAGTGAAQTITLSAINATLATNVSYSLLVAASAANTVSVRFAEVDYDLP